MLGWGMDNIVYPPCFLELEEAGKCQRGSSCRFSHAISQAMRDDAEIQRKVQEQKQSKRGICINEFRCPDSCLKGERCTFRHEISEQEKKSSVLKEKMEQKWKTITGRTSNDEENLNKSTAIVMLQEFRNLMKNFNKVMGSHRPWIRWPTKNQARQKKEAYSTKTDQDLLQQHKWVSK